MPRSSATLVAAAAALAATGVVSCGGASQPVEGVWTMPTVPLASDSPERRGPSQGMPFTYMGSVGVQGGDAVRTEGDGPGDLPETGLRPSHGFWRSDEREAALEAHKSGKGMLVSFFAEWSEECRRLERDTLRDPDVRRAVLGGFVPLRIDVTEETHENREQSARYAVRRVPSLLVLDAGGKEIGRFEAFVPPDVLLTELREHPGD
jgi:hypothetical protein